MARSCPWSSSITSTRSERETTGGVGLDPVSDGLFNAYLLSKRINEPIDDFPDAIEPVDFREQSGLGEFGFRPLETRVQPILAGAPAPLVFTRATSATQRG